MMSKNKKDTTTTAHINNVYGVLELRFFSDCGKFGTEEILDEYKLTPERLLQILQEYEGYSEDEL